MRPLLLVLLFLSISNLFAQDCVHCRYYRNYMGFSPYRNTGFKPIANHYLPWWYNYSMPRYSYYNRPAPWMNYGINGKHYPNHGGGGMVGKPNLYVYGKTETEFSIELEFEEKSLLLLSVPAYDTRWSGRIINNGILYKDAFYAYFYYDYGVNLKKLQWTSGSCVKEEALMGYLNKLLKAHNFNKVEIDDFNEYWSFKMPPAKTYCIFPQVNKHLSKVVKIKVTPKATINRLIFFIVPQTAIFKSTVPYLQKPIMKWKPVSEEVSAQIHINEWGVAFLDEKFVSGL